MRKLKRTLSNAAFGVSVLLLVSPAALVFLWMLSLSLKNELDNTAFPPVFIPDPPTLDNYREVFARNDFLLFAWNSVVVSFSATTTRAVPSPTRRTRASAINLVLGSGKAISSTSTIPASEALADKADRIAALRILSGICWVYLRGCGV